MALLRGSAGDWPEMGEHGPKHYQSRHVCHCLGSEKAFGFLFVVGCLFYRCTLYVFAVVFDMGRVFFYFNRSIMLESRPNFAETTENVVPEWRS